MDKRATYLFWLSVWLSGCRCRARQWDTIRARGKDTHLPSVLSSPVLLTREPSTETTAVAVVAVAVVAVQHKCKCSSNPSSAPAPIVVRSAVCPPPPPPPPPPSPPLSVAVDTSLLVARGCCSSDPHIYLSREHQPLLRPLATPPSPPPEPFLDAPRPTAHHHYWLSVHLLVVSLSAYRRHHHRRSSSQSVVVRFRRAPRPVCPLVRIRPRRCPRCTRP